MNVLDTLVDAEQLRQRWQRLLPGFASGALQIDTLHLAQARRSASHHRHPHPLTVRACLQVHDTASGRRGAQALYGKVFRPTAAAPDPGPAPLVAPAFGQAWAWIEALHMAVWALPNDPGLPQLPALLHPDTLTCHLPPGYSLSPARTVALCQHTPEVRALVRVQTHGPRGAGAIYGKTFANLQTAQQVQQRLAWAWAAGLQDRQAPRVPQPLGLDETSHTVWQAAAEHPALDPAGTPAHYAAVGRALAWWHRQAVPAEARTEAQPGVQTLALPQHDLAHFLGEARRRQKKIARVATALDSARASALLATLEQAAPRLAHLPAVLLHGDFHAGQVALPAGAHCLFFDLDEMALGPAMADLTAFALRLGGPARAFGDPAADHARTAFLQGYRSAQPGAWHAEAWHWHVLLQSLQLAARAFVFQRPGWRHELSARLVAAEPSRLALLRALA